MGIKAWTNDYTTDERTDRQTEFHFINYIFQLYLKMLKLGLYRWIFFNEWNIYKFKYHSIVDWSTR